MKCVNGHSVSDDARFCGACGSAIVERFHPGDPHLNSSNEVTNSQKRAFPLLMSLKSALIDDLVRQRTFRLAITPQNVLFTSSGILLALTFITMSISWLLSDSDSAVTGATLWALSGAILGYVLVRLLDFRFMHAASTLTILCVVWTPIALFVDAISRRQIGLPMILAGMTALLLWCLPGFRARPVMLVSCLILIPVGVSALLSESATPFMPRLVIFTGVELTITDLLTGFSTGSYFALLVFGLALIAFGFRFEKSNWTNLATSFLGAGISLLLVGAFGSYVMDHPVPPTVALCVATVLLIVIGNIHSRRTTLVIASLLVSLGLVFAISALLPTNYSISSFATLLAIAGLAMAGLSLKVPDLLAKINKKDVPQ